MDTHATPAADRRTEYVLEVDSVVSRFGAELIHDGVSFKVAHGEVVALIGSSGTGKSVLVKEIIGLLRPAAGAIRLLGTDVWGASQEQMNALRRSEERRVGKECRPLCRSRWSPYH